MPNKKYCNTVVMCLKSLEGLVCVFDDCVMFSNCFPEAAKELVKECK